MATARERHPELLIERNEDPRARTRTVPMQVLSLGYSRTGTMSMKAALEALGIPTWHWVTMVENPPDMDMWADAFRAKYEPDCGIKPFGRKEFDGLLSRWGAVTDYPPGLVAEELINAYPEAKVILVERDADRWYKSFSETVIDGSASPFIPIASKFDKSFMARMCTLTDLQVKHCFNVSVPRTTHGIVNNPEYFEAWRKNAKDAYLAHNERIKRITPKDRLLLFDPRDGWAPLCEFLGKPVPDEPFPKVNETAAGQEKIMMYISQSYKRSAIRFVKKAGPVAVALAAVVVWWAWQ